MCERVFYLDGKYLNADDRLLDVFTPGRWQWHGVFETMRVINGKIEFYDEHIKRLLGGLKTLNIRHTYTALDLKHIVRCLIRRNPMIAIGRARVLVFEEGGCVHCAAMVLPYQPLAPEKYRRGLRAKIVQTGRPAHARYAGVKSLDYAVFADAHQQALATGYDEALLLNDKGHVFEASRANIFICSGGKIITPPLSSGCLEGIIRGQVITIARQLDIPVLERNLTPAMVKSSDYAFLTNSLAGLVPLRYN